VVSHDRYFLERVTDVVYGLLDDGRLSLLPGGVDEYLERRRLASELASPLAQDAESAQRDVENSPSRHVPTRREGAVRARAGSAEERAARKTLARVEKRLEQVAGREQELNDEVLAHASDHERLTELSAQLSALAEERDALEAEWLEAAEILE
jgi:ATP-binding cassette subfamily F protein uup